MRTASQARILVVDDDPEMRAYIRRCLAPITADVVEASNAETALEHLRTDESPVFALVIADVVMPGMGGHELHQAVQRSETLRSIPVLLVTGEATPLRPGEGTVLVKPFNGRLLRTYVRELLSTAVDAEPGPSFS